MKETSFQWQPLGPISVITTFNFPVAVWSWNTLISAVVGDVTIWKPSSRTPLTAISVTHLVNQVLKRNSLKPISFLAVGRGRGVGREGFAWWNRDFLERDGKRLLRGTNPHRGSDCGLANVNTSTAGAEIGGAFGGEKQTAADGRAEAMHGKSMHGATYPHHQRVSRIFSLDSSSTPIYCHLWIMFDINLI